MITTFNGHRDLSLNLNDIQQDCATPNQLRLRLANLCFADLMMRLLNFWSRNEHEDFFEAILPVLVPRIFLLGKSKRSLSHFGLDYLTLLRSLKISVPIPD